MKKRIFAAFLILFLAVFSLPEMNVKVEAGSEYYTLNDVQICRKTDAEYAYVDGIEGGKVKFDKKSGTILSFYNSVTSINIPAEIDGVKVRAIADWAIQYNEGLTEITLPEGLETIGQGAFRSCPLIKKIVIPDSVTSIGNYSFRGCDELETIVLGNGLKLIGESSIRELKNLKSVKFGKNLSTVGKNCFSDLESIKSLVIPGTVADLGDYCFRDNDSLESLIFEDGVNGRTITDWSLQSSSSIKELYFGEGFTEIGQGVGRFCSSLETVHFPTTLKSIGNYAFRYCTKLENVTVGKKSIDYMHQFGELGITLGDYPFTNCYFLRKDYSPSYKTSKWYKALHELELTGDYQSDILKIARSQIGYHEGNSFDEQHGNNTNGNKDYAEYNYFYGDPGTMWCGEFVDWCYMMAGVPDELYSLNSDDEAHEYEWKETTYAGGSYKLKPGDIILFLADHNQDHVIMVESIEDSGNYIIVHALDGNHSQSVVTSTWKIEKKTGKTPENWKNENGHVATIYGPDWSLKNTLKYYTVSFDANGGKTKTDSKKLTNGAFYGVLPIPTRSGYTFDGWYTKASGGVKITAYRTVDLTGNTILYAHWTGDGNTGNDESDGSKDDNKKKDESSQIKIKASKTKLKASTLKKKALTVTIKVSGGKAKVTYKNASSSKLKKHIVISSDGIVTFAAGTPKGTYKIKVTVTGNDGTKTEKTIKIKVK